MGPLFRLFYRRIDVVGMEKVPNEGALIFTPNHRNAVMDALCILCTKNVQPVFVARADSFSSPLVVKIFHFLRMLPIFRRRDGVDTATHNQDTFDILEQVLHHRRAIGIMPEGVHNKYNRLQPLQKGVFRIAMQVQEKYGNAPMVKIVPVGLDYTSTRKFRSDVIINYGEPIEVADYYDLYTENQARAYKKMQDELSRRMKEKMVHIANEECYEGIDFLRRVYTEDAIRRKECANDGKTRMEYMQGVVKKLEEKYAQSPESVKGLQEKVITYKALLEKHNLRDKIVGQPMVGLMGLLLRSLVALIGMPLWLAGLIINYAPYKYTDHFSRTMLKDPQFIQTIQYVGGGLIYVGYYLVIGITLLCLLPCWWKLLVLSFIPLGDYAFRYYISMKKLRARWYYFLHRKDEDIKEMQKLRGEIVEGGIG